MLRSGVDGDDSEAFRVLSNAVSRVAHQMSPHKVVDSTSTLQLTRIFCYKALGVQP